MMLGPSIYKSFGIYKTPGNSNVPFIGDKTNEWIFDINDLYTMTDKIGGIVANQINGPKFTDNGLLDVGYRYGVCTKVNIENKDYIEIEADLGEQGTGADASYHIRYINAGQENSIGSDAAFLIWRGGSSNLYWSKYWEAWGANLSGDYGLFEGYKKIGIFKKTDSLYDIYLDNQLIFNDLKCKPTLINNNPYWSIGCSTTTYSQNTQIALKRITIYKNCEHI